MAKVRRTSGAVVLPLVAAAVGLGVGATPADAAICSPLSSASITGPSGTITAGSIVHASARVSGMLLTAHMQITGPGLDQQVGPSIIGGTIEGDVRVPNPGVFTLTVTGNGLGCVYDSDAFSVKARPSASTPTPHSAASEAPSTPGPARASKLPKGIRDGGTNGFNAPSGRPPFRLPAVAPDGTGPSVHYPSADPQVAAPPVRQPQPRADNAAQILPPIKWGQSIAIALVLLLLSAHMGMWSRRQRLAAAGARRGRGTRGARRADAGRQVAAQRPFAGDHRTGTDLLGSVGQGGQSDPRRDMSGRSGTVGENGRTDSRHGVAGQAATIGTAGATTVDWKSWVGIRRQMGAEEWADSRDWADAQDGRADSGNRDAHVDPNGDSAGRPLPYALDRHVQPGHVSAPPRADQAEVIGWAAAPPASDVDGRDSDVDAGRDGFSDSVDRVGRSGRSGYRGRRRRS